MEWAGIVHVIGYREPAQRWGKKTRTRRGVRSLRLERGSAVEIMNAIFDGLCSAITAASLKVVIAINFFIFNNLLFISNNFINYCTFIIAFVRSKASSIEYDKQSGGLALECWFPVFIIGPNQGNKPALKADR